MTAAVSTDEVLAFLRGTKTSEYMPTHLKGVLNVRRRLQDGGHLDAILANSLAAGSSVVVAGSAGGGKTALLEGIVGQLPPGSRGIDASKLLGSRSRPTAGTVAVVPDLTAVQGDRGAFLSKVAKLGLPMLIAANEGVLHRTTLPPEIASTPDILRTMQSGLDVTDGHPVVVDLAGMDPIPDALPALLAHDDLLRAARAADGCHDEDLCPRSMAFEQLAEPSVVAAVTDLVKRTLGNDEALFRELWDFLSDLLLGGSCDGQAPTSPWFWRIFYGDSSIAQRLRSALRPEHVPLPRLAAALYFGDWQVVIGELPLGRLFVDPGLPPADVEPVDVRHQLIRWLKAQVILLSRGTGVTYENRFIGEKAGALEQLVQNGGGDLTPLIRALNAYFERVKPKDADGGQLSLWADMAIERRTHRSTTLVSLGRISSTRLSLVRSTVLVNHAGSPEFGSRLYLSTRDSKARLALDSKLFSALARGRAVGSSDRTNDDADFAIRRFYFSLASLVTGEDPSRLETMSWLAGSSNSIRRWRVNASRTQLEVLT